MMRWNTSTDCCNWDGVTCDYSTGDVIGLDLGCGMLKGTIHPNSSLFNLPHLQRLNLTLNDFNGSQIPSEIGRLSNSLTHLDLSGCLLSGQVPPNITLLHKLVSLDISFNNFKIRPHVFNNLLLNFTNLKELSLAGINISMVLPTSLNISSSLKELHLHFTELKGTLPHNIFNLRSLEKLTLSHNHLVGSIPSEISDMTHLTSLNLARNKLNGTLPSWLFTLPFLEILILNSNMFSGNVPFQSFTLPSLKLLDLSYNHLAGQIDVHTFAQLTNITDVYLSSNNFSGEWELDTVLSNLTNLDVLDLSDSGFYVTTKNVNLSISHGLKLLYLVSCKLKAFPNSIQWYGLEEIYMQSNLIEGPFPPSICNMSKLRYLDLSNNRFGGLIPQCFGNITSSLEMIDMGNNSFQGTIPDIYGDCGSLQGISLNGNQLRGGVPISFSKCQSLKVVDLGNNHLIGTFPGWLGNLPDLQVLVLKSNNFHGHIQPSSTVKSPFPSLLVLDLSYNGFVGQLPVKYFENFNSMKNVVRKSTTPKYLSMGGKFYSFIAAVKGVNLDFPQISVDYTIIDMSVNTIEGKIPNVVGGLNSLIVLNLSHNSLIGQIPHALGKLFEIESLDLSWNQLSGEIPQSLADIKTLEVLNLSQNLLVGHIPQGSQFRTFEGNSFGGNPRLCGTPLLKKCTEYSLEPQFESDEGFDEESGFTWEAVMLGYGCGTLLGLMMGYLMLSTRKVKWFNAIADLVESLVMKKKKKRHIYIGK